VSGPELWSADIEPVLGCHLVIYMRMCILGRGGWLREATGVQRVNLKYM
jgi:hypothetical protein